ncbi:glycosyltransferase family 4 protein [Paenibacillus hexagrammi]|uniref:Glycosyltransferase family 4 protein n=1 Tax=Paenibacillus hexagrammi TaxID=2908839 RepID=A0ABY3SGT4_9BACL|nr:glycosyltransferase family 4 protein [Paenibacillus sp. YPD9-1]UJF32406.1 glycosyltransferase family 4 protein [Paenibacillus sp. YPD9-1]
MKILIVAPEQIPVPPLKGGSVEICIYAIARELAKHHQVTVISRTHPRYSQVTKRGALTIKRVASGSSDIYLKSVLRAIKGTSYDWIQVDNRPRYAALIKRKAGKTPVSLFLHSLTFVQQPHASRSNAAEWLAEVDRIIANSASLKKRLSAMFPTSRHKIKRVYLGTDVSRFRPASAAEKAKIRREMDVNGGFQVLFAGRIIRRKGIPVLIKAMHMARKQVPGAKLLIAGSEHRKGYKAQLRREAKRLSVPLRFLGNVPHGKVHHIYWLADCFVCPSQKHEAFGLVNVEAMASGLPVIASANGGIKEIIKHGRSGIAVKAYRRPQAFAKSIVAVAHNRAWAGKLARQARIDAVKRFSWQATARTLAACYRKKREGSS